MRKDAAVAGNRFMFDFFNSLSCHSRVGGNPYSRGDEVLAVTDRPVAMDSRLRGNDNL